MTAKEVASKQIMEVVINGSLAKAADGNGLRAFSRTADGKFIEHARLYNADTLSKMVNMAAVWQIASVVVAQKHLADINKKLEELQDGVDRIVSFQEDERETRLLSICESLKEKAELLAHVAPAQRKNIINTSILSGYDDNLKQIYMHLKVDIKQYGSEKVEHKEMFGTAELKENIDQKIKGMKDLFKLASLCLNLRLVCCNFMDYLEEDMGSAKVLLQNRILKELESFCTLFFELEDFLNAEVGSMDSIVNNIQKNVSSNKGKILGGIITISTLGANVPATLLGVGIANLAVGSLFNRNSKSKSGGVLDKRKEELLQKINQFSSEFKTKCELTKEIALRGGRGLIEKEPLVKLAFQKLDEHSLICLNTGETIVV